MERDDGQSLKWVSRGMVRRCHCLEISASGWLAAVRVEFAVSHPSLVV